MTKGRAYSQAFQMLLDALPVSCIRLDGHEYDMTERRLAVEQAIKFWGDEGKSDYEPVGRHKVFLARAGAASPDSPVPVQVWISSSDGATFRLRCKIDLVAETVTADGPLDAIY